MKPYKPHRSSTVTRLLDWLTANPVEELTRHDIAVKFDVTPNAVYAVIRQATEAGMLVSTINRQGELVYRLGHWVRTE